MKIERDDVMRRVAADLEDCGIEVTVFSHVLVTWENGSSRVYPLLKYAALEEDELANTRVEFLSPSQAAAAELRLARTSS